MLCSWESMPTFAHGASHRLLFISRHAWLWHLMTLSNFKRNFLPYYFSGEVTVLASKDSFLLIFKSKYSFAEPVTHNTKRTSCWWTVWVMTETCATAMQGSMPGNTPRTFSMNAQESRKTEVSTVRADVHGAAQCTTVYHVLCHWIDLNDAHGWGHEVMPFPALCEDEETGSQLLCNLLVVFSSSMSLKGPSPQHYWEVWGN